MAKKQTIAELVVKLQVDSKAASNALKKFQKGATETGKKTQRDERNHWRKRNKAAKAWLAQSREFHKLKARSGKDALKAERELKKAYMKNDKVQAASIKRQISERLSDYKMRDKQESDLVRKQVKSRRAMQAKEDKSRKLNLRASKEREQSKARELRTEKRLARIRSENLRAGAKTFSKATTMPFGRIAVGGGAAALGAGYAGSVGAGKMLNARRAQTSFAAMFGDNKETARLDRRLQRINAYYNMDNALAYSTAAGLRGAISNPNVSGDNILDIVGGMGAIAMGSGAGQEQVALATKGMQQMIGSGTMQMQEVYQQTEAIPLMGRVLTKTLTKVLGRTITQGEMKRLAADGSLRQVNTQSPEFVAALISSLSEVGVPLADSVKGSAPERYDAAVKAINDGTVIFFQGFENELADVFTSIQDYVFENQELIRSLGQKTGEIFGEVFRIFKESEPYITNILDNFNEWLKTVSGEDVVDTVNAISDALAILFGLFVAGKVVGGINAVASAVGVLGGALRAAGFVGATSAATGAVATGAAGMTGLGVFSLLALPAILKNVNQKPLVNPSTGEMPSFMDAFQEHRNSGDSWFWSLFDEDSKPSTGNMGGSMPYYMNKAPVINIYNAYGIESHTDDEVISN